MAQQTIHHSTKQIYQMLWELATANNSYRIEESEANHEYHEIIKQLNHFASNWQKKTEETNFPTSFFSYQSTVQKTVIIAKNGLIKSFTNNLAVELEYTSKSLLNESIYQFLDDTSQLRTKNSIAETDIENQHTTTLQLVFITATNQKVAHHCTISKLHYFEHYIINTLTTVLQNNSQYNNNLTIPRDEIILFNQIYEFICNYANEQLPSTKEIAKLFGLNEGKLKHEFRNQFNTSIYQLYTDERLKKSHQLIQQTQIPLKEIAFQCGFNSYLNFYKAFRKKYNYTPSEIKRDNDFG